MKEQLYLKKGRRYVKVGPSDGWNGFPCDGVWLVYMRPGVKSSHCIFQLKPDRLDLVKRSLDEFIIASQKG